MLEKEIYNLAFNYKGTIVAATGDATLMKCNNYEVFSRMFG